MYCSGCGQILAQGQTFCPQCGRPVAAPVTPMPGYELQLHNYAGQVRALGIVWFIYAGVAFAFSILALTFANVMLAHHFGSWAHNWDSTQMPFPSWIGIGIVRFAWFFVLARGVLSVAAGWGLYTRAPWGRIVAIIAAVFSVLRFPLGTAMAIWTLVMLLGYRNTTLYEQLPQG